MELRILEDDSKQTTHIWNIFISVFFWIYLHNIHSLYFRTESTNQHISPCCFLADRLFAIEIRTYRPLTSNPTYSIRSDPLCLHPFSTQISMLIFNFSIVTIILEIFTTSPQSAENMYISTELLSEWYYYYLLSEF